jgi:hypothetical protein
MHLICLIYCFFLVKSCFFIEKVHILRITHFSETTKDRSLIFGKGGDSYNAFNLPSHPDHKYIWFRVGISVTFFKTDFPAGWGFFSCKIMFFYRKSIYFENYLR